MKLARTLTVAGATLITTVAASAQSFNIDFGTGTTPISPANTFGAAAGQVGVWQTIASVGAAATIMNDITGAATAASISCPTLNGSFFFNNAVTAGDDQALLDDCLDLGLAPTSDTFTITGLQNGNYTVYTYAWAPDDPTFVTTVTVNGGGATNVGGGPFAGYVAGNTHAVHNVVVAAGTMTITLSRATGDFGSFNGLQLVIPGPGSLALLGLAGLIGPRRRRN